MTKHDHIHYAEVSIAELSLDDLRSYHKKSTSNGKIAGLSFASGEKTKLVAVKSLKADVLMSEDSVLEFIEEIKVLHKLVHRYANLFIFSFRLYIDITVIAFVCLYIYGLSYLFLSTAFGFTSIIF